MLPLHTDHRQLNIQVQLLPPCAVPLADAITSAPDAAVLERETAPAEGTFLAVRMIAAAAMSRRGGLSHVGASGWADKGPAAQPGSVPARRRMADDAAAAALDRTTAPNAPAGQQ